MKQLRRWVCGSVWLYGVLCFSLRSQAFAESSLATELARLRGEVEALASQIEEKKEHLRNQLRALSMQRSALALSLDKERLRLRALMRQIAAQRSRVTSSTKESEEIVSVAKQAAAFLLTQIARSLPFRLKERTEVIEQIQKQLQLKLITSHQALARLWQAAEDELRLGKENGLYNQTITLEGKTRLVQVARLGMILLFFKTRDGRYGAAEKKGQTWVFQTFRSPEQNKQVEALFDGLKKQIRSGFWTIPDTLPR